MKSGIQKHAAAHVLPKQCATYLSCILGPVNVNEVCLHVVFSAERVHKIVSNTRNMHNKCETMCKSRFFSRQSPTAEER